MAETLRLGNHCEKIGSGATPRGGKEAYFADGPIALIRSQNIYNDRFSHGGLAFISQEQADQLQNVEVKVGDVLLNITGDSVARACQVDPAVLPARVNQHVAIIRPKPEQISARFLRYYLVTPSMQAHMFGLAAAGATRNALTKSMIEAFRVPAWPVERQRSIAAVLGALDDKIELNRRMNETLEAIARAIFKDWLVDFGPTRAKLEGRAPYLTADIWSLFPDRLDDDGEPEGWQRDKLGNLLEVLETGGRPKGGVAAYRSGVPSVGAESIVGLGKFDFGKTKFVPKDFFASMRKGHVQSRDVLLYKDGGKPGLFEPHVTLFGDGFPFEEFAINEHVYRMRAAESFGQNCLFFWLSSESVEAEMRVKGTGVAIPGLNSTQVKSLSILVPSRGLAKHLDAILEPFVNYILANCNESKTLAVTRDLLLPKLMSGEVRVKDAEKLVGEGT